MPTLSSVPAARRLDRLAHILLMVGCVALLLAAVAGHVEGAPPLSHQDLADRMVPAWSQTLPAADRFVVVMGGVAVLDRETGVVWEQAPDSESALDSKTWYAARSFCNNRVVGNRKGWRLPTVQELASLVDTSQSPALPAGHPFTVVVPAEVQGFSVPYWSATTQIEEPNRAWFVDFNNGFVFTFDKQNIAPNLFFVWCVRGGHGGPDAQ